MKNVKIKRLGAYHHHKVDSSPKINNGMLGFFERKNKVDLVENKLVFDIEKNNWTKNCNKNKVIKKKGGGCYEKIGHKDAPSKSHRRN